MHVFLSWSGVRSRRLAQELQIWLKPVIQAAQPWMSDSGIDAGQRWSSEIAVRLRDSNFGVICVTPENVGAPWLLFEAGVLSKAMENARVVPLLLGLPKPELPFPLAQFQAVTTDRDGMLSLVLSMNAALGSGGLAPDVIGRAFGDAWPRFEQALATIPPVPSTVPRPATPSDRQLLEDVAQSVRFIREAIDQRASAPATRTPSSSVSVSEDRWKDHFIRGVDLANRYGEGSDLAALRCYNDAIAFSPGTLERNLKARLFGYRGAMFKRLGRLDEAMSDLRLAETLATDSYEAEDAKYNIACVLAMTDQAEQALDVIRDLVRRDEKWRRIISQRAITYFKNLASNAAFRALTDAA
jgi:tetratricopeptide (TPR) repeat protein